MVSGDDDDGSHGRRVEHPDRGRHTSLHREDDGYRRRDRSHDEDNRRERNGDRFFEGEGSRFRSNEMQEDERERKETYGRERRSGTESRGRDERQQWGRGDRGSDADVIPELYSIHKATVRSVRPFGIFVQMEGFRKHALIHVSHVSEYAVTKRDDADDAKVKALQGVAGEGDSVWVKVVAVKEEEPGNAKIGASMKLVNQRDGSDKDPQNVQLEEQMSKPRWQEPKKMELGAVYNVTCTRCGGHGHLKTECYASLNNKTYELLPEVDITESEQQGQGDVSENAVSGNRRETTGVSRGLGVVSRDSKIGAGRGLGLVPGMGLPVGRGRGRAMTQPAWMTHGVGIGGEPMQIGKGGSDSVKSKEVKGGKGEANDIENLPLKISSKEDALAVIAKLEHELKSKKSRKEEKRRKKEKRKEKKEKRRERRKKEGREKKRDRKRRRDDDESDDSESESESDSGSESSGERRKKSKSRGSRGFKDNFEDSSDGSRRKSKSKRSRIEKDREDDDKDLISAKKKSRGYEKKSEEDVQKVKLSEDFVSRDLRRKHGEEDMEGTRISDADQGLRDKRNYRWIEGEEQGGRGVSGLGRFTENQRHVGRGDESRGSYEDDYEKVKEHSWRRERGERKETPSGMRDTGGRKEREGIDVKDVSERRAYRSRAPEDSGREREEGWKTEEFKPSLRGEGERQRQLSDSIVDEGKVERSKHRDMSEERRDSRRAVERGGDRLERRNVIRNEGDRIYEEDRRVSEAVDHRKRGYDTRGQDRDCWRRVESDYGGRKSRQGSENDEFDQRNESSRKKDAVTKRGRSDDYGDSGGNRERYAIEYSEDEFSRGPLQKSTKDEHKYTSEDQQAGVRLNKGREIDRRSAESSEDEGRHKSRQEREAKEVEFPGNGSNLGGKDV